jgi:hypothetical protein
VDAKLAPSRATRAGPAADSSVQAAPGRKRPPSKADTIGIDDFARVQLKVARVTAPRPWKAPTSCCA